jgi:imidazolonepropionase-like amidohydrolase
LIVETREAADGERVARLAEELGIDVILVGSGDEHTSLESVSGTGLSYLLPLDFPPRPTVGDEDDLSISLEMLRRWDLAPENPRRLLDAGVRVAFTSHRMDEPRRIHEALATAIERGLTEERALAALTTTPAEMAGIADRAGTLEPGKMANLVVVEGSLFVERPRLVEVWIDGVRYPLDPAPPEGDSATDDGSGS